MMFEFCASVGCGILKEIASKEISHFNSFCSMSGKFKHHKKLENVKFEETINAVSVLHNWGFVKTQSLRTVAL